MKKNFVSTSSIDSPKFFESKLNFVFLPFQKKTTKKKPFCFAFIKKKTP